MVIKIIGIVFIVILLKVLVLVGITQQISTDNKMVAIEFIAIMAIVVIMTTNVLVIVVMTVLQLLIPIYRIEKVKVWH